jgi:hypothetical protein
MTRRPAQAFENRYQIVRMIASLGESAAMLSNNPI